MPKVPDHFCESAIVLLQGGTRCADVTIAINANLHNVRHIRHCSMETGRTADHPYSDKPHLTMCSPTSPTSQGICKHLGGGVEEHLKSRTGKSVAVRKDEILGCARCSW